MSFFDDHAQPFATLPPRGGRGPNPDLHDRKGAGGISPEAQELAEAASILIGSAILYKLLRRLGAPRWAAYGIMGVQVNLRAIRHALEKR